MTMFAMIINGLFEKDLMFVILAFGCTIMACGNHYWIKAFRSSEESETK